MRLTRKSLSGAMQPLSLVDRILTQQGFRRKQRLGEPLYDMKMQDSATKTIYFLRIPVKLEKGSTPNEPQVRIGCPYIDQKKEMKRNSRPAPVTDEIPVSIMQAAEHKLAEIADYLKTQIRSAAYIQTSAESHTRR